MKHISWVYLCGAAYLFFACSTGLSQPREYDPFRSRQSSNESSQRDPGVMTSGEFVDTPITDVLRVVSDLTGWSIIVSPSVSATPPKVDLWIKNMSPEEVLNRVIELGGLVSKREGNTFNIMTFDEYSQRYGVERKVRQLVHASATDLAAVLQPFVAKSESAMVVPVQAGNKLVLLIPEPLLGNIETLIDTIDAPFEKDRIEVVHLKHLNAAAVVPELEKFLVGSTGGTVPPGGPAIFTEASETSPENTTGENNRAGGSLIVQFMSEPELNAVVIRGLPADVVRTMELLEKMDHPTGMEVVSYELKYTDADQAFETIEKIIENRNTSQGRDETVRYGLAVSVQNNRIVVRGSPEMQDQVAKLVEAVDQPLPQGSGEVRVYRLENANAQEVVAVIQDLLNEENAEAVTDSGAGPEAPPSGPQGANPGSVPSAASNPPGSSDPALGLGGGATPPRVTAAPEINAVVVRASASEHNELSKIIAELDRARNQVLIEVTLVNVFSDDEFSLGVEVGGTDFGTTSTIGITNFGIGQSDPANGSIRLPATGAALPFGLNFSVFRNDDFSLVLNALQTVGKTRISSAPKILVADNSPGLISQVEQEPFEVASQGDSSTLTSFGGFVDAGTTLNVTPHISKDDWIRLDYDIILSTFGNRTPQQLQANLPPPRTENTSTGTARVPAGHVVVLGGLVNKREDDSVESIPLVGDIPLVGELFKNRRKSNTYNTLFIFIRPVIMRDIALNDLRLISEDDISAAEIEGDSFPSNPLKFLHPIEQAR